MNKRATIASKGGFSKIRPDTGAEGQKSFCTGGSRGRKGLRLVGVANAFTVSDGEATELVLPYGTYPAGRRKTTKGQRHVLQRWNRASAEAVANQLLVEKSKGAFGIPVYIGHPDVPDLAGRYPNKAAVGWITEATTGNDSSTMIIEWNDHAYTRKEFAYFSPYWFGSIAQDDGATVTMDVEEIGSVGLTNTPNIHQFRIPNEVFDEENFDDDDFEINKQPIERDNQMILKRLIELFGLPGDSDEEAVFAAVKAAQEQASQLAAANSEKEAAETAKTEAEKARDEAREEFANERKGRVELVIANALSDGRITPADTPRWEKLLTADFKQNSVAIANETPKFKTTAAAQKTDAMAVANTADRIAAIQDAVAQHMSKGLSYDAAYRAARKANPELFKK